MGEGTYTLVCDRRLGGVERWRFSKDTINAVRIHDDLRKCIAFIGANFGSGPQPIGTCTFVGQPLPFEGSDRDTAHIVTAAHVIKGIERATNEGLRDGRRADGKVYIRLDFLGGSARWVHSEVGDWYYHPDGPLVDVAVLDTEILNQAIVNYLFFPMAGFATKEKLEQFDIGVGDETYTVGLFMNHYGTDANLPIVRAGTIAAMPEQKIYHDRIGGAGGFIDAYLIEGRSIRGLSGSPTFVHPGNLRRRGTDFVFIEGEAPIFLLGIMIGHWELKVAEEQARELFPDSLEPVAVNAGIALVVPEFKIRETINQEEKLEERQEKEKKRLGEQGPTLDAAIEEDADAPTRKEFYDALKKVSRPTKEEGK